MRYDWTYEQIEAIYDKPLLELIFEAATIHRQYFDPQKIQVSSLISIKTGGCPEDCHYCPQAARYNTGLKRQGLLEVDDVVARAKEAKERGASRMCLGAAWREVKDNAQFDRVLSMVREVNGLGMEVCCTLGMLNFEQASRLKEAGLYAYNHNVDTSREHYDSIISTRGYDDRLRTLGNVREARLTVCSGGIIGLGETKKDRIGMLMTLSNLQPHPDSVPINTLVAVEGTPLENQAEVEIWDLVRMVATTRIVMPRSYVRLSAGRRGRSMQDQALCFMAGANSIFAGDKLLTTANPEFAEDAKMLATLGLQMSEPFAHRNSEGELVVTPQEAAHHHAVH